MRITKETLAFLGKAIGFNCKVSIEISERGAYFKATAEDPKSTEVHAYAVMFSTSDMPYADANAEIRRRFVGPARTAFATLIRGN
jgi:hypothetical protein